jgi:3-phosphoshikimate 1-carboxyvinyltransferase
MTDRLEIVPLTKPPKATVRVPGSKSITNRALVLAALSGSGCELHGVLRSEDTEVMVEALRRLGFFLETDWSSETVRVNPNRSGRIIPAQDADLFVSNSGTTVRFLTAMVSLGEGRYRLDGVKRMRERPIEDLLQALRQLGVVARCEQAAGCPPVVIESGGWRGCRVRVRGDVSSQFLSALLMAAPFAATDKEIEIEGRQVSWSYVSMTLLMMMRWGLREKAGLPNLVRTGLPSQFTFSGRQRVSITSYVIEPDASAASYFLAAPAIAGGQVTITGLGYDSIQGDIAFGALLDKMGCRVTIAANSITVHGGPLRGIDVDMNDISDTVMTLGAVALFAEGPTTIRNVAHIRHKETDRLAALAAELRRVGAEVEEFADGLRITPRPLHGAEIETYNDHRMAMSMALVGLKVPGVVIKDPGCVAKTYPNFFSDLERLRDAASPP